MQKFSFNAHDKFEIDKELHHDLEIDLKYDYLRSVYNEVLHITFRNTGKPVPWEVNLKYDEKLHDLIRYFDIEIIEQYDCNESKTLAHIPQGVAMLKLHLLKDYDWQQKVEIRLLAIISNILILGRRNIEKRIKVIRNSEPGTYTKNEMYNILLVLNSKLSTPIADEIINKLTSYVWLKYQTNELKPTIEIKKSITRSDFMTIFIKNYPECAHYSKRSAIIAEINRIKFKPSRDKFNDAIQKYKQKNPECKYTDVVNMLMRDHKLKKSNAGKKYCEWKKVSQPTTIDNSDYSTTVCADTILSSEHKIARFFSTYTGDEKLTQEKLASETKLSISTIKRKWRFCKNHISKINKKKA